MPTAPYQPSLCDSIHTVTALVGLTAGLLLGVRGSVGLVESSDRHFLPLPLGLDLPTTSRPRLASAGRSLGVEAVLPCSSQEN